MRSNEELDSRNLSGNMLWDEDALIERLVESLEFAETLVGQLGAEDEELPAGLTIERLVADTAIMLLAASNVSSYAAVGPRIGRVAGLLVDHARSPRVLRQICLEPASAFEHATAHICLNRLDFYDPDFDAMLDLSVAALASDGRERLPHRMLEQEWLRQGWLFPEGLPRLRAAAQMTHSVLNRTMDLLAGTTDDVRSFTRALMVLRDFNLYPRPLPRSREKLLAEAEGMLARCLAQDDYQLAAEVLMAWPLTGEGWSAPAVFGFQAVMETAWAQPSKGHQAVYTMGMLCAVCLAPGRRPPVTVRGDGAYGGIGRAAVACLQGVDAAWMHQLTRMEPAEQEPLASFLLCIALQRAFAREEFQAMERLLGEGKRLGLTPCPTGLQSAELLARVAQCGLQDAMPVVAARAKERMPELCPV